MKTLQVRDVPDDLHRRLKARAALEGRSLSALVLAELRKIADRPSMEELADRVRSLERVTDGLSSADAVRAEREGR